MWASVNQPSFREEVNEQVMCFIIVIYFTGQLKVIAKETFDKMDLDKNGYVSKKEYMKWNSWKAGEEQALAVFNMMDSDNDGRVFVNV